MVKEALELVDADHTGTLSFEELVHLLTIYRHSEGFTRQELGEFRGKYVGELAKKKCGEDLPADQLASVLTGFYGPLSAQPAAEIGGEVVAGVRPKKNEERLPED